MKVATIVSIVVLALVVMTLAPFGLIWCFNTLFMENDIPYTFKTWFASLMLFVFFPSLVVVRKY